MKCSIAPEIPNNHASLLPFRVTAPKNCILNAQHPAPVSVRHVLGHLVPDAVLGACTRCSPERCQRKARVRCGTCMSAFARYRVKRLQRWRPACRSAVVQQRWRRRTLHARWSQRHGVSERCAFHVDRGDRACGPGDFLAQGTAGRFRWCGQVPWWSRPGRWKSHQPTVTRCILTPCSTASIIHPVDARRSQWRSGCRVAR